MKVLFFSVIAMLVLAACAPATSPASPTTPSSSSTSQENPPQASQEERVPFSTSEWQTNFKRHSVPFEQIFSGGPSKDGIPAIDEPKFVSTRDASAWLKDNEPVILFQNNGDVRAYPMQILIWHEIVNDTVGGMPVAVTFCPLCNTSIVFDRTVEGQATTFGTTGRLRYSDLVMYDRATESWWQQATGLAIVGDRMGTQLKFLPSQVVSFGDLRARYPDGKVLSRDTGHSRSYGLNPYGGYDAPENFPFLYQGPPTPDALRPKDLVVALVIKDTAMAYPYRVLGDKRVVNDTVAGEDIVVFWKAGTSSALDARSIAQGRDIGTSGAFSRKLNDKTLTFSADGDKFKDTETSTVWNIFGQGIEGALTGQQLTPLLHGDDFWFAWAAFRPDTKIYSTK